MTDTEQNWHAIGSEADFPEDNKWTAILGGWSVLVVRTEEGLNAVNDRCTHLAALLSPGRIRRGAIICPLHGARFEADTGRCIGGLYADLRRFEVRIVDGVIEVAVPSSPPGPGERPVAQA
ncbi:Rieske (2Fe-2S) protein [Sphingobium subterraneum]|uniref:3-phenylpropionate/trans-cinnamate dioxygenase ferredoxin subunit n=1 Tax=Sphingobium subterraneum TaxID=627688 RepID=A0A841IYI8_9SPHN|nr:Rieske (2Fe-2S) protein [Sphingobium subterraneum]MBB6124019.1 3-phenylpropionate/trans-cinnamate dioxygenase ferredoxin subunit [Sphingobium subterraneum]